MFDLSDVAASRAAMAAFVARVPQRVPDDVVVDEVTVPRPDGGAVPVRRFRPPPGNGAGGALVWCHGGGFVMGSPGQDDAFGGAVAGKLGIVVLAPGYRLAPEDPHPAAVDDVATVVSSLVSGGRAGVDPARVALGGQSAGGGIAASVALRARDAGWPLALQVLVEPELDHRLATPSMLAGTKTVMWTLDDARHSWAMYLAGATPSADASPSLAEDLAGLAPAYVRTNELDPLRDEGLAHARRLLEASVPIELHHLAGTYHGFNVVASASVTRRTRTELLEVLHRHLVARG